MKCERCGKKIDSVMVNKFIFEGVDGFFNIPIIEANDNAVYVETDSNWTGYELTEEEMINTIICPQCLEYPFNDKEIQVHDVVQIVMFESEDFQEDKEEVE